MKRLSESDLSEEEAAVEAKETLKNICHRA